MSKQSVVIRLQGHYQGVRWTNFLLSAENLEAAYDAIAGYLARGLVLEEISIGSAWPLADWPVEVFTAQSLEVQTQPIQQEWEAILSRWPTTFPPRCPRKDALAQRIFFYAGRIERTRHRISQLEESWCKTIAHQDAHVQQRRQRQFEGRLNCKQALLARLLKAHQQLMDDWPV